MGEPARRSEPWAGLEVNFVAEVLRLLDRGRPFRVAVPGDALTRFLTDLVAYRTVFPPVRIRRIGSGDVWFDFDGAAAPSPADVPGKTTTDGVSCPLVASTGSC